MSTAAVQHECAIDDRNSNQLGIEGSNHRAAKYHIFVCKSLELGLKSCITFEENHGFEMHERGCEWKDSGRRNGQKSFPMKRGCKKTSFVNRIQSIGIRLVD